MTTKEIEKLITFVLDLSSCINKKITGQEIDLNNQHFSLTAPDLYFLFKNIETLIIDDEIDKNTWNDSCNFLGKNYNLKLTTPDIALDEILIVGKTLLGLSAANFRKIENETE